MEPKLSLRTPRRPSTVQGCRPSSRNPSTMQASWASPMTLSTRHGKGARESRTSLGAKRPQTATEVSRASLKTPSHLEIAAQAMTPLRSSNVCHSAHMPDCWASSRTSIVRPQTSIADSRPSSIASISHPQMNIVAEPMYNPSSMAARPHTSTGDCRSKSKALDPTRSHVRLGGANNPASRKHETQSNSSVTSCSKVDNNINFPLELSSRVPSDPTHATNHRLQSVKSYSSPRFSLQGFSPPESPKQSVFDARSFKHPKFGSGSPKFDGSPQPSRVKHTDYKFDPSLNLRSQSINGEFRVDSTNPMESLVTQMPVPPVAPSDSSTHSISPSAASKMLRKQIEAALRMYPRNTWGPVTKWGYQEELAPGKQHQKDHFMKDKDKLEKQRLESRRFGHQKNWVNFKNVTNYWEQSEARQCLAYSDEKERFLRNSEKMLHAQNDKRILRAKYIDEAKRVKKRLQEFKRLERREGEYIDKMESEQKLREDPQTKVNDSGVVYNIVTLEYPNNYAGDLLRFEDAQIRWRQSMRALRLQSKQSGARMYNVLSWKPKKPCCVPPPKPDAPVPPDPNLAPSPRKPELPVPKNMLHLKDTCEDVPIGNTSDHRTNW